MAVGAYACYKLMTGFPDVNIFFHVLAAGGITALVCTAFGLPSLRIKGFYLAVATLAAQFFLVWLFNKVSWFYNYSASGQINAPERTVFGIAVTGANTAPWATYLFCLVFLTLCAYIARNLTRGAQGRKWMAIRDMDIAAEIIGVNPMRAKLSAFAVSGFFIGISGALFFAVYLGAVEVGEVFGIQKSFLVLFMIIIGGLGSIFGSFAGAAFLVLLPVVLMKMKLPAMALSALMIASPVMADLVFPSLSYRTGPYAAGGIPFADGYQDYFTLLNERDGGIGGVPARVLECETGYNTEKGVECYESTKGEGALVYQPLSTGITYQLIPKATADGIPIHSMGYGRTSAANGKVFSNVFNYPANYWNGASGAINYLLESNGGDLSGKKVALEPDCGRPSWPRAKVPVAANPP